MEQSIILNSAGRIMRFRGYYTIAVFTVLGISWIFVAKPMGKILGLLILGACFLTVAKASYKVKVNSDNFEIKRLFSTFQIPFSDVTYIYKNREGFAPIYVHVVKYSSRKKKIQKITFDANQKQIDEVMTIVHRHRPDIFVFTKE